MVGIASGGVEVERTGSGGCGGTYNLGVSRGAAAYAAPAGGEEFDLRGIEVFAVGRDEEFGLGGSADDDATVGPAFIAGILDGVNPGVWSPMGACPIGAAASAATGGVHAAAVSGTMADGAEDKVIVGIGGEAGNGVGRGGDADGLAGALCESLWTVFTDEGVDVEAFPKNGGGVLGDVDDFDVGGEASFDAEVVKEELAGGETEGDTERGLGVGERVNGNDGCVLEPGGGELGVGEGKGVEGNERGGVGNVGDDANFKQRASVQGAGPEVDVDLPSTLWGRAKEWGNGGDAVGGRGVEV